MRRALIGIALFVVGIVLTWNISFAHAVNASWKNAVFPVPEAEAYTSGFGLRQHPITNTFSFHSGQDIAAPAWSPVLAWAPGKVIDVQENSGGCGTEVFIETGKWDHRYCHLNSVLVVKGKAVKAGQAIGQIGETGGATGPHLHLELRWCGTLVNPMSVFRVMYEQRVKA